MKRTLHGLAAAGVAAALSVSSVAAAPITVMEPPDLSDLSLSPTSLGPLDVGLNTVSGSIDCREIFCQLGDRSDSFRVDLPDGLRIVSISLAVSGYSESGLITNGRFSGFGASLLPPVSFSQGFGGDGTITPFSGATDGPGDLHLTVGVDADPVGLSAVSFSYIATIAVEASGQVPVPEPAGLALVGLGLFGLALVRRSPRLAAPKRAG